MNWPIVTVAIDRESDIVAVRQIGRRLAEHLGFAPIDQTRVATAISEIARNAHAYAGKGRVTFSLDANGSEQFLTIQVTDDGPGMTALPEIFDDGQRSSPGLGKGLAGARRLMDRWELDTAPGHGTTVTMGRRLPVGRSPLESRDIAALAAVVTPRDDGDIYLAMRQQNAELLLSLAELTRREEEGHTLNLALVAAEVTASEARRAAEEANRAKSEFIANLSHEFRTPLSAVIGYSEMLQEEIQDLGVGTLAGDVRKIEANARHLLGLINDVLDFSKIEAGRMEVFAATFDVAGTVRDVAATVEGLVTLKGNTLHLGTTGDVGSAHTDEMKLRQCLINLLSNAAKFTENGVIRLDVRRETGRREAGERLVFTVSDTGIGMTPEQVDRLFERFRQADAETQNRFGGTGLGLSITQAFAAMLGGEVTVNSRHGEGTTFVLCLPTRFDLPAGTQG